MLGSWEPWALPDRAWSLGVHTGSLGGYRVGKGYLASGHSSGFEIRSLWWEGGRLDTKVWLLL